MSSAALAKRISAPPNKTFCARENDRSIVPAVIFMQIVLFESRLSNALFELLRAFEHLGSIAERAFMRARRTHDAGKLGAAFG